MIEFISPFFAIMQERSDQFSPETVMVICGLVLAWIVWIFIKFKVIEPIQEENRRNNLSPEAREQEDRQRMERRTIFELGEYSPVMVCPHCQTKGKIRTKHIDKKTGISGGKATAAVITGGISVLATGLSRTDGVTQAHCE